ncbi:hypothetical protein [Streptomyces californicus]|uniref:hypothetical protein n=1 Tax=Streptomyces californicus TaxID=67351 RepID=UPI00332D3969
MPPAPPPSVRKVLTSLDHRVEAAVGYSVDRLWENHEHGLLDPAHARLAVTHRDLVDAELSVTFYRTKVGRLLSGEFPVDDHLMGRVHRALAELQASVHTRDEREPGVTEALQPIEAARRERRPTGAKDLPAADFAALLAIAQGAKLHENLLTQRRSVATASGMRIAHSQLERLLEAGLVAIDTSRPVHAGQPVTPTEAARTLLSSPRPADAKPTSPIPRPGAWPAGPRAHR